MTETHLTTLSVSRRALCSLNREGFFQWVLGAEILWSHLELLVLASQEQLKQLTTNQPVQIIPASVQSVIPTT